MNTLRQAVSISFLSVLLLFLTGCGDKPSSASETPVTFEDRFKAAERLSFEGRYAAAIEQFESLRADYPDEKKVFEPLALAYGSSGDFQMSIIYLNYALQMDPQRADLLLKLAETHAARGNATGAIESYKAYLAIRPADAQAQKELARLYTSLEKYPEAFKHLQASLTLTPDERSADPWLKLGQVALLCSENPAADTAFQRVLQPGMTATPEELSEAHLGGIEATLRSENWLVAWERMARMDKEMPGALDKSRLAHVRDHLNQWKQKHDLEKAKDQPTPAKATLPTAAIEAASASPEAPSPAAVTESKPVAAVPSPVVRVEAPVDPTPAGLASAVPALPAKAPQTEPQETPKPLSTVVDALVDKALVKTSAGADTPAETPSAPAAVVAASDTTAVAIPSTSIPSEVQPTPPAEPAAASGPLAAPRYGSIVINGKLYDDDLRQIAEARAREDEIIARVKKEQAQRDRVQQVVNEADAAFRSRNFSKATKLYADALADDVRNPRLTQSLSQSHFENSNYADAEIFARDAVRLERLRAQQTNSPEDPSFTIYHLKTVRRALSPMRYLEEVKAAKDRMPLNADITLMLAEAYDEIAGSRRNAEILFREFLDLAPNDPRAVSVRNRLPTPR